MKRSAKLGVVIPVVNWDLFDVLFSQIGQNTVTPNLVVIINNNDYSIFQITIINENDLDGFFTKVTADFR